MLHATQPQKHTRSPQAILAITAFAAFLATFNETYLNIGFTPIMRAFHAPLSTVQWLATAYMLSAAVMIPVAAFAYRSLPTRQLFLGAVGMLILGSILGGLAPSFPVLLAGRIVQALGTGIMIPLGMNITLEVSPHDRLGVYVGIMCAMTALGPTVSVLLAGVFLSFFGWQSLLWSFAALAGVLFLCAFLVLPDIAELTHPRLDLVSVLLNGLALIGLLYGLSTAFSGASWTALASFLAGLVLMAFFLNRQKRLVQPLLHLETLSCRPFTLGALTTALGLIVTFALNILTPTFLQEAVGASALSASLTLFPAILVACIASPLAGKFYDHYGPRIPLLCGFLLALLFSPLLAFAGRSGNLLQIGLLLVPIIGGSAIALGPSQSFALSRIDRRLHSYGITVISIGFQIAGCLGSSLFTGLYFAVYTHRLNAHLPLRMAANGAFTAAVLLGGFMALLGLLFSIPLLRLAYAPAAAQKDEGEKDEVDSTPEEFVEEELELTGCGK